MASITERLELVGAAAVVLSLVFVALEIRHSTNTAASQAVFELNEAARETQFIVATDPDLVELIFQAEADLESLTDQQYYRYRSWVFSTQNLFESAWTHHQRGVISDDEMNGWASAYCNYMSIDSYRAMVGTIDTNASGFMLAASSWCDRPIG